MKEPPKLRIADLAIVSFCKLVILLILTKEQLERGVGEEEHAVVAVDCGGLNLNGARDGFKFPSGKSY